MTKHEDFSNVDIELRCTNSLKPVVVKKGFWDAARDSGYTWPFIHAGTPHVHDPANNNYKISLARLVMDCDVGQTAKVKNPDDPLNLTPDNLKVVKDGRSKKPAKLSKGKKPQGRIPCKIGEYRADYGQIFDWINAYDCDCPDDIVVIVYSSEKFAEPEEIDLDKEEPPLVPFDEEKLRIEIKGDSTLEGGVYSPVSKRVTKASPHEYKRVANCAKYLDDQLKSEERKAARSKGYILPNWGKNTKRWAATYFNAGKAHRPRAEIKAQYISPDTAAKLKARSSIMNRSEGFPSERKPTRRPVPVFKLPEKGLSS